jgi:transposase-like protein
MTRDDAIRIDYSMKISQLPTCQQCRKTKAIKLVKTQSNTRRWKCQTCIKRSLVESKLVKL